MHTYLTLGGSPSSPSRTAALLERCAERLAQADSAAQVNRLSVRDLDARALLHGLTDDGSIRAAAALVAGAHGIILATPTYKAAYTGILKAFLDLLPADSFAGKTILPIATGAAPTHALMIDYALRPVCMALGAHHVLPGLYVVDSQISASDGRVIAFAAPEVEGRLDAAVDALVLAVRSAHP